MDHEHDYRKLSEVAVFCRGCGDIKGAEPEVCLLPHYPTYWPVAPSPYITPYIRPWWQSPTITIGTVTSGSTFEWNGATLT